MNFPPVNLSSFHSDILEQTQLGQLCGKQQWFRGRYEILRMLGRGGFGVTFLAKDVSLPGQPLCVIKQLCPKVTVPKALESARQRFKREAKILAQLGSHSQIPMLLDYFDADGEFYLIQEYVRGMTLARRVRRYGCATEVSAKRFLREMLQLLHYIHSQGVIHRDIKPQNIIIGQDDNRLVLIDFGAVKEQIAHAIDSATKMPSTHFVGTVGFAPPEQFSLRPVFGSDIYALGVTCLYLLTGKAPLDFDSDCRTGELQWRDRVELSESFATILNKMLKISLHDRYQSAMAILQDLDAESPRSSLAQCLATQPYSTQQYAIRGSESHSDNPHSPFAKTASAIREWKYRMKEKQRRNRSKRVEQLMRHSDSSGIKGFKSKHH